MAQPSPDLHSKLLNPLCALPPAASCSPARDVTRGGPRARQAFGVALSYRPMFYELNVAIFGTPKDLFKYDA